MDMRRGPSDFGVDFGCYRWGLMLLPKIPWIGKLPGDIFIKGEKVTFYFPITTCIIISLLLTLLLVFSSGKVLR